MLDILLGVGIALLIWILFVTVIAHLRFFGIYIFKWKTLDECPFLISSKNQITEFSIEKKDRYHKSKESLEWIVGFVKGILEENGSNSLSRYILLSSLSRTIDTSPAFGNLMERVQLKEILWNSSSLIVSGVSVTIQEDSDSFVLSFDVKFIGEASLGASGSSKTLSKIVDIKWNLMTFAGKFYVSFMNRSGPSILGSVTSLPEVQLDVLYGNEIMSRLSKLSLLVFKSILNSHLVYPNYLQAFFRRETIEGQKTVELPISLFNPTFLKINSLKLHIPPAMLDDIPFVSCHFMFGGQKSRVETVPSMPLTFWNVGQKFPFPLPSGGGGSLPLLLKVYTKKKKSGQSILLEEAALDVELSRAGSMYQVTTPMAAVNGMLLTAELTLLTADVAKGALRLTQPEESAQVQKRFLNGLSWTNLKTAMQSLVTGGPVQDDVLKGIIPEAKEDGAAEGKEEESPDHVLDRLRFYEHQIVNILQFLAEHGGDFEEDSSLAQVQHSLEAFRADLGRMIETYPNTSHGIEDIGSILQSFLDLVGQKIAKVDEADDSKEVLQPIESHLKSLVPAEEFHFSDSGDFPGYQDDLLHVRHKKDLYLHDTLVASEPILSASIVKDTSPKGAISAEFLCHLGARPVSLAISEDALLIECLQKPSGNTSEPKRFKVFSLAESYGLDLSLEAIEAHQFTKKWILTVEVDRITLVQANNPPYFPYLCISLRRLLKVKAGESSKAPFLELYYLQDEEQNYLEYQKIFASVGEITKIYEMLQAPFVMSDAPYEIQWNSIEKIDLIASTITIFKNPTFDVTGTWEAIKLGQFFGVHDIHDAYCELQACMHRRNRGFFSPSPSQSPLNVSTTSLTFSIDASKRGYGAYHLIKPIPAPQNSSLNSHALANFGLAYPEEQTVEFSCSYLRRGINVGRIVLTPDFLCFNGKRNGVRTSKMVAPWHCIESIEFATRWYSRGFLIKLEDVQETLFFFGFRKDSLTECYTRITNFIELAHNAKT